MGDSSKMQIFTYIKLEYNYDYAAEEELTIGSRK